MKGNYRAEVIHQMVWQLAMVTTKFRCNSIPILLNGLVCCWRCVSICVLAFAVLQVNALRAANARTVMPAAGITEQRARALELQVEKGVAATHKLLNLPGSAHNPKIVGLAKTFGLQRSIIHYNKLAVHWWSLAAKWDFVPALDRLAWAYYAGKGAPQLYVVAMQLWRAAAKRGDAEGACNLAVCYQHGWGTTCDPPKAVFWMKKAAAKGEEFALYHLGDWYADGYGLKRNQRKALICWKKAAALGGPIAKAAEARINAASAKPSNPPAKP